MLQLRQPLWVFGFDLRLLAFKTTDYLIPVLNWSPIGVKMKSMIKPSSMIDANDQSGNFDVFWREEAHIN